MLVEQVNGRSQGEANAEGGRGRPVWIKRLALDLMFEGRKVHIRS